MTVIRRSGIRGRILQPISEEIRMGVDDNDGRQHSPALIPPQGPKDKRDETNRRLLKPKFSGAADKPVPIMGGAKNHAASVIGTLEPEKDMEKMGAQAAGRFQISRVMRYDGKKLDTHDDRPAIEPSRMDSGQDVDESLGEGNIKWGNFIQQVDDKIWALYEKVAGNAGGLDSETKQAQSHFFQTKKRKDHDAYLEKLRGKGLDPEARARKLLAGVAEMAKRKGKNVTVSVSSPHGASFFNHGARAMCRWEDGSGWSAVKVETLPLLDPQFLHKAGNVEALGSDKPHKSAAEAAARSVR